MFVFIPACAGAQVYLPASSSSGAGYSFDKPTLKADPQLTNSSQFWLNIGPAIGTSGSLSGIASVSYQFGTHLLSLRGSVTGEVFGDHFSDISLLYGRATTHPSYHVSFAAGIARVTGQRNEGLFGPKEKLSATIGFPSEMQIYWKPASFFGLGITGFTNINREQSFAGMALSLQLGKLR